MTPTPDTPQQPTTKRNSLIIGIAAGAAALLLACCIGGSVIALLSNPPERTNTSPTPTATPDPTQPTEPTETTEPPHEELTPAEQLAAAVDDALGTRPVRDLDRVVAVDTDPDDPTQMVVIEWTIRDALTSNGIHRGAQRDVIALIEAAQEHVTWDYAGLRVIGTMEMYDELGNAHEREVINVIYSPELVAEINPRGVRPENILGLGEGVVHPEFR